MLKILPGFGNKMEKKKLNFQNKVVKHLIEKGFNCVIQPKPIFPEIIAWKPFTDMEGRSPILMTQTEISGRVINKQFVPFFVALVECNSKKYLNKKKTGEVKKILEENRCNVFLVAYKDKKNKLEFQEINLKERQIKVKPGKKEIPSYLG
jgi:hypothetical protein